MKGREGEREGRDRGRGREGGRKDREGGRVGEGESGAKRVMDFVIVETIQKPVMTIVLHVIQTIFTCLTSNTGPSPISLVMSLQGKRIS